MNISVVTTFNEKGYKKYAQRMIKTFLETWPKEVTLYVYAEDCVVQESAPNLIVLNLCEASPELMAFKKTWKDEPMANGQKAIDSNNRGIGFKWDAIRFSHKVYAIFHCAKTCKSDALIWMDGDSVCHSSISLMQLKLFCPESVDIAYLGRKALYTECGLYYLNLQSNRTRQFLQKFQLMYDKAEDGIFQLDEWHDSYVFDHVKQGIPSLIELDWAQDLDESVTHPLVNSFWGDFVDHLKGDRKDFGSSFRKDFNTTNSLSRGAEIVNKVIIFLPRLDLPWKQLDMGKQYPLLSEDVLKLRLYWKEFVVRLANVLERSGMGVEVLEIPAWEITREKVEQLGVSLAFIPHRCNLDFEEGKTPVLFYMQEYFKSVFVVNDKGWSASSSLYPFDGRAIEENSYGTYESYQEKLFKHDLSSKFDQKERQSFSLLASKRQIPSKRSLLNFGSRVGVPYIFFPLQIPHDQSIKYFSDYSEEEIVQSLVNWGKENEVPIVLKPHPANKKIMKQFYDYVDGINIFWSDAHVHDLISYSTAVFTINSGVGFESLFHEKPVVTFGRAEYDCVTFRANLDNISDAWSYCIGENQDQLGSKYKEFIDWFLNEYAIDMSNPESATNKLKDVVEMVKSKLKESEKSFD